MQICNLNSKCISNGSRRCHACPCAYERRVIQKPLRIALVLLLVPILSLALAGCRDTDVLTQKIIDAPGVSEIDYSLDPVRDDNPERESGNDNSQYEDNDTERTDYNEYNKPDYSDNDPTVQDETSRQERTEDPSLSGDAQGGGSEAIDSGVTADSDDDSGNGGIAAREGDGDNPAPGNNADEAPAPGTPEEQDPSVEEDASQPKGRTITVNTDPAPTDDPQPEGASPENNNSLGNDDANNTWNPGTVDNGGGEGDGKGQTYNDGTFAQLPQKKSKIAAAGPYATIVQSLGGRGALAACNQEWLDSLPATAYSNQVELADVVGIEGWGDGRSMDGATVQAIIDSGAEIVLTSDTYGGVVTDDQAKAFNDAGVDVVVMPPIGVADALDEDVVMSVAVIGELLKDAGPNIQYDAKKQAAAWNSLHIQALERTMQYNGGYTTLLTGDWARNWIYQGFGHSGNEISPSRTRYYASYIDYWVSVEEAFPDSNGIIDDYWQHWRKNINVWPYRAWDLDTTVSDYSVRFDIGNGIGLYIHKSSPSARSQYALFDFYFQHAGVCDIATGQQYQSNSGDEFREEYSNFHFPYGHTIGIDGGAWTFQGSGQYTSYIMPGDEIYPYIIVRDKHMAENVRASASRHRDQENRIIGAYDFGRDYAILVMPAGIDGSWTDGGFESFLVTPWAFCMYQQNGDLSYSNDFVNSFYSSFYRCDAAGVLDGEGNWGDGAIGGSGCGGYGYTR